MVDEPQAQGIKDEYAELVEQWRRAMVNIHRARHALPSDPVTVRYWEKRKAKVERQMHALIGNDPDDETAPPF